MNPMRLIETAARMLLGAVFIYAGWGKILDPAAFAVIIGNYQILPPALIHPAALLLPWLEMVCGICLIVGRLVRGSALIVVFLMAAFMGALAFSAAQGLDVQCGCFSNDPAASSNLLLNLLRDLILLGVALAVLLRSGRWADPVR
jgi:uncharacterized membrane protein YphA (DoxX/SURF4 family)